ncbi:MAG: response regulator [Acutalibacteraceae bacterium]
MRKYKVILADDEPFIRTGLQTCLREECPALDIVGIYANGAEVIDHLRREEVDIVISDIQMPVRTGLDVARYIWEKRLVTRMIIITGYRDFEYAQKALDYRVKKVIVKPVDIDVLLETIEGIQQEIDTDVSRIHAHTRDVLRMRTLRRQDFFMMLSGSLSAQMIIRDRSFLFTGMPLENRRAAVAYFCCDSGGAGHTERWQDMGELETDKLDIYFIAAIGNCMVFLGLLSVDTVQQAERLMEQWAADIQSGMHANYQMTCEYKIEQLASLNALEGRDVLEKAGAYNTEDSEQNRIFQIIRYINENFAAELSLDSVSQMFYLNPSYLSRLFKKETGGKFIDYLVKVRLNKAKELLAGGKKTVNQVSEMVGYTNTRYFRQIFKEHIGLTPQQYMIREATKK